MLQPRQCFKVLLSQIVTVKLLFLRVFMYLVLKACLQIEVTHDPALFQQTWLYYYYHSYYCTISAAAATAVVTSPRACLS